MALIKCPECGKIFSDHAAHCPQCGLPTNEALEIITTENLTTGTSESSIATQSEAETTANRSGAPWNNIGGTNIEDIQRGFPPRYEQPEPKKQRNLLTYILIVAVIVLAIVCIALVVTTSGVLNSSSNDNTDSITGIQTLPPDTQAVYVEEEPETKPVIRTELQEEITFENENAENEAAPTESANAAQPAGDVSPITTTPEQDSPAAEE